ncbi:RimJ/RimL family protein N-acetyltransferase [Roseimicrobium gellanilyticum]|uniref:RimJ/RimL family protein N-acetyltransferase n=1 Tax=Roseimicrobium gellanilyticum TaxID=748857 RepID=A0A366HRF3_9BACT|nr:GNAT family N-acetyltransferase [Roseimicrobium gellanilyticum]RBP46076.1 RimJ/RimL family protein N-acetyltransferase [Roseimicrobium gellanilyticum]
MLIASSRLDLVPFTLDFMRASLAHDTDQCSWILGATVPPEWPEPDYRYVLDLRIGQLEADPNLQPWLMRAMVDRETRTMVGDIGFHTAPAPEYLQPYSPYAVEFGFSVFPEYRRKGYAREAAKAMMHWATDNHGVTEFIMTIRPDNLPSQALAAQLGFVKIASHIDEIDGEEDILELRLGK